MESRRTENTTRNIIWGILNQGVMTFMPFIVRTVLLYTLGTEYLGLNSLFSSIIQVLNLTELGFSSAVNFNLYKAIADENTELICALMEFYKRVYRIMGLIILCIGLIIIPFLKSFINGSYPAEINIYTLYLIYLFNTVITYFLFAYKNALINAHQRVDLDNKVMMTTYLLQYSTQIISLFIFLDYYLYLIFMPICTVLANVIRAIIANKMFPNYSPRGKLDSETTINIRRRVCGVMISKFCVISRNSFSNIFISSFLGLTSVAIYGNYYYVLSTVYSILNVLILSMQASVGNSIIQKSIKNNYHDMQKISFIFSWLSTWFMVCMLCLYQPFIRLWVGNDLVYPLHIVVMFCVYFYSLSMIAIVSMYAVAAGIWWEHRYAAVAEAITNILLNYLFCRIWGVSGVIMATFISILLFNFVTRTYITFKMYFKKISPKIFYANHLFYAIIAALTASITYYVCSFIPSSGFYELLIKGCICIVLPNVILLVGYNRHALFKESMGYMKIIMIRKNN